MPVVKVPRDSESPSDAMLLEWGGGGYREGWSMAAVATLPRPGDVFNEYVFDHHKKEE